MKVQVIKQFRDKENNNVERSIGEIIDVDEERLKVLMGDNEYKENFVIVPVIKKNKK